MKLLVEKVRKYITKPDVVLLCITLTYVVAGFAVAASVGRLDIYRPFYYSGTVGFVSAILLFSFLVLWILKVMVFERPKHLAKTLVTQCHMFLKEEGRFIRAVPILFCFVALMSSFTSLKTLIPAISPFHWDEHFMLLDKALHFGTDPWRLLDPVLGYAPVTYVVNFIYNLWFFVMFAVLYWQLFSTKSPVLRMRFFITFFLTWIINGTLLAMVFSSAGPCFYAAVTGSEYYIPLMDYLQKVDETYHLFALVAQDLLWKNYLESGLGLGTGISAMPSLHVAIAVLLALLGARVGRKVGVLFGFYALCILLGSVHLGWHYAIDGYVSGIVTLFIWYGVGLFLKEGQYKNVIENSA